MANLVFMGKTGLTGGEATKLDSIDGDTLTDNDAAFVNVSNVQYIYRLDADSGAAESSPNIIAPDTNPGTKRWILQGLNGASLNMPGLTASLPVFTDGSKNLVSNTMTGTGKVVMDTSPTLVTPTLGAASGTSLTLSGLTASLPVFSDGSKKLVSNTMTGTGKVVMDTSPTLVTPTLGAASGTSLTLSGLTASLPVFSDGSKKLVSNTMTGTGKVVMDTSPTLVTPNIGAASGTSLTLSGLTASLPVFSDASKKLETKTVLAAVQALYAQPGKTYSLTDGATIAINWNNGATQYVTLGSTGRTVTFANPVDGQVYRFIIIQGSGGSKTITTWPTIKWAGGAAPTLSTTAAYIDIVTLLYCNSVYYGDVSIGFRTS